MERKLASIQRILDIQPIEGADKIVRATINGWHLVTAVDNGFKVGDLVIYLEVDSWVPTELAPFLSKGKEPREFEGVKGERLRTIKLRGQVSQGLIMPIPEDTIKGAGSQIEEGLDLTEHLGILKWEKPLNAQLQGVCRGNFPSFIRKTDQERVQNLKKEIAHAFDNGDEFEVSEKLDGSSMTVYAQFDFGVPAPDVTTGVCSRNLDLELDQEGNHFVSMAKDSGLLDALLKLGRNIAVQGELCGPSIQGNNEGLTKNRFFIFDIFDIDTYEYVSPALRHYIVNELYELGMKIDFVSLVPVYSMSFVLPTDNIDELLVLAEGINTAGNEREGLVLKRKDGKFSFKIISNKFLLGEK